MGWNRWGPGKSEQATKFLCKPTRAIDFAAEFNARSVREAPDHSLRSRQLSQRKEEVFWIFTQPF